MELYDLTEEERLYFSLKRIYKNYGYRQYRMRKFEEYSLYAENISFLKSRNVITFSDSNGKLLALKPDVTLSIVKNNVNREGECKKLFYRESVYRPDSNSAFREISQIGLEYLGEIDGYAQLEVLTLAAETLKEAGGGFVIDVSHMGIIEGIMEECRLSQCPAAVADCIKAKNLHDMPEVCKRENIPDDIAQRLCSLLLIKGGYENQLDALRCLFINRKCLEAADELESLFTGLKKSCHLDGFNLDFSVINDANYYNGVIFQGYIQKFPKVVLSGGRYDNLVSKFGGEGGGMGFALYPDDIGVHSKTQLPVEVNTILVYGDEDKPYDVLNRAEELMERGEKVYVARSVQKGIKFVCVERFR